MKRVTLRDVSALAGVSRSTASLVLNDSPTIPEVTRHRVTAAIEELGYVYNRGAAGLRNNKSMIIGLIATEIGNPYFAELTMALEDALAEHGFTLLVGYSRDSARRQTAILDTFMERFVDGLVLLPARGTDTKAVVERFRKYGIPLVLSARSGAVDAKYVGVDNVEAGSLVGRHLRERGASSVAFVGGELDVASAYDRLKGAKQGIGRDIETLFFPSPITPSGGAAATAQLLDRGIVPDAIIGFNDVVATGVYAELISRQLRPGEDVAIVGFDDIPISAHLVPPLTSVATFPELTGSECAEVLLRSIEDREDSDRDDSYPLIRPEIRLRESTTMWKSRDERRAADRA